MSTMSPARRHPRQFNAGQVNRSTVIRGTIIGTQLSQVTNEQTHTRPTYPEQAAVQRGTVCHARRPSQKRIRMGTDQAAGERETALRQSPARDGGPGKLSRHARSGLQLPYLAKSVPPAQSPLPDLFNHA